MNYCERGCCWKTKENIKTALTSTASEATFSKQSVKGFADLFRKTISNPPVMFVNNVFPLPWYNKNSDSITWVQNVFADADLLCNVYKMGFSLQHYTSKIRLTFKVSWRLRQSRNAAGPAGWSIFPALCPFYTCTSPVKLQDGPDASAARLYLFFAAW